MTSGHGPGPIYGLMAEFETPTELVHAAKGAYAAGYRKMDTYTPYPLEEAAEAIGAHHNRVSLIVLIGAMLGAFYPAIKAAQKDPIDALAYE